MAGGQRIISDWAKVKTGLVLNQGAMEAAGREAAEAQNRIWRERTMAGLDRRGKRLRRNSPQWEKQKGRYLAGKVKHRKGKPKWLKWTEFKATSAKQVGRFTGRTLLDFKWKNVVVARNGTNVGLRWDMFVSPVKRYAGGPSSAEVVGYLRKMDIDIHGATISGPYRKKEEDAIREAVKKRLGLNSGEVGTMRVKDL